MDREVDIQHGTKQVRGTIRNALRGSRELYPTDSGQRGISGCTDNQERDEAVDPAATASGSERFR